MQEREETIKKLNILANEMCSLLIEAGVKPSFVKLPENLDKINTKTLMDSHDWLARVRGSEWFLCKETKNLLSDEQWGYYRTMDMNGTIEMTELKQRLRKLRKAIINKTRPQVFRRKNVKE